MRRDHRVAGYRILRALLISLLLAIAPHLPVAAAPGERLITTYQARPMGGQSVTGDDLAALQQAIQQRLSAYGITDANAQVQGSDQIVVDIPNTRDAAQIVTRIGQIGLCEFVGSDIRIADGSTIATSLGGPPAAGLNADGQQPEAAATATAGDTVYQTLLQSADIADVVVADYRTSPVPTITFTLRDTAAQAFADYTSAHVGQYISIVVDKRVVSSANVRERINGMATLQGLDLNEMGAIAAFVRSGPLTLPLAVIDTHLVTPTV